MSTFIVDGTEAQQHGDVGRAFCRLCAYCSYLKIDIVRIIELGTGSGGLTAWLARTFAACKIVTYDHTEPPFLDVLIKMGIECRHADVFSQASEVAHRIAMPGGTLLLCDGGSKVQEVRRFARYLKGGDIVMAHDYRPTKTSPAFWRSCEIIEADIAATCKRYRLKPILQDVMLRVGWLSRIKETEV